MIPGFRCASSRLPCYRMLFRHHIAERTLEELREATNKAWGLGNDRFKKKIEAKLDRHVSPKAKGGDRKSKAFLDKREINGAEPH